MAHKGAFLLALENLLWATIDVFAEGAQSIAGLLDHFRQREQLMQDLVEGNVPALEVEVVAPVRQRPHDAKVVVPLRQPGNDGRCRFGCRSVNPQRPVEVAERSAAAVQGGCVQWYYAIAVGHRPGIYLSWREAADEVLGFTGNVHQSFTRRQDAEEFIRQNRNN